jgi:diguanylate cyclase (GGDEF)-like protein
MITDPAWPSPQTAFLNGLRRWYAHRDTAGLILLATSSDRTLQGRKMKSWRGAAASAMKKLISAIAMILGCASVAWAAAPGTLTTLHAVHSLTNAEASQGLPAVFEATVTYYRGYERILFVQDGDLAIFVFYPGNLKLVPGDRVLVRGRTQASFNPIVVAEGVALLRHAALFKPMQASFDQMIRAQTDCKLVTVRGTVRAADLALSLRAPLRFIRLQLLMDGGNFDAEVDSDDAGVLERLLDADVELTGVVSEEFDDKMHETGILMHVQSLSDVRVIKRATSSPWSLPLTPMDKVITVSHLRDSTSRVRVHGTITYYQPGSAVVLQDGAKSIWISTRTHNLLRVGDEADATGFPDVHDGFLNLVHGEVRDTLVFAPVTPLPATWKLLTPRGYDSPGHHDDLVSIEGLIVTKVREASQDEYVIAVDDKQFSAIYRHPDGPVPVTQNIPLGARVRVTGICILQNSSPYVVQVPFNILMRSPDDIVVVAKPSLLNIHNLIIVLSVMLLAVIAVSVWGWTLNGKVRRQTGTLATMAEFEQHRSRILEDINGTEPLAAILEQITGMVSLLLHGVPCWCEITGGARLGNCPPELAGLHIVNREISARSGPPLGTLFAAFDAKSEPQPSEKEALLVAARLATLAIETRRRDADLRHRSEFDLLTDVHNRFSLEKRLNAQIDEARQNAGIFGLIYIDLDKFKQVNDLYGHHIGDLYLQEVTLRLKRQLRPGDLLARLGGDEFAVLLPTVRDRAGVEDVVHRLEHSFNDTFVLEGHNLHGAASFGIALYPENSTTGDGLLNAADAAMYAVKNSKL